MQCINCGANLPEGAKFCAQCGTAVAQPAGPAHSPGISVDQQVQTNEGQVVGLSAGKGAVQSGVNADVKQDVGVVKDSGAVVGAIVGAEGPVHVGGQQSYSNKTEVNTDGGVHVSGNVRIGGDLVGRDKVVHGDEVRGDKITAGNISGEGIAIGRGAQATVNKGSGEEIAHLFAAIYRQIETRPEDPKVEKQEIAETVQKIETEVAKSDSTSPDKVERWLKNLVMMAPDIWDVTIATLANPVAGVATAIRKVAEKAKAETGRI